MKHILLTILLFTGFVRVQAQTCTTTFTPDPPVAGSNVTANSTCSGLSLPANLQIQIGGGGTPVSASCTSVFGSVVCTNTITIPSGTPVGTPIYAAVEKSGSYYGFASTASLAIALTNFETTIQGSTAVVTWSVATDEVISAYHIEKQINNQWVGISAIEAKDVQVNTVTLGNLQAGIHNLRLVSKSINGDKVLKTFDVHIEVPNAVYLSAVYPNPFSTAGTLEITTTQTQSVEIKVFDLTGRMVTTLHEGVLEGNMPYQFNLDGQSLGNGTYVISVKGHQFVETRLFTVTK